MSEKFRALVVGCGRVGGGYNLGIGDASILTHALAYRRHAAYELVGCVDTDPTARAAFMEKWSVPRGYSTLDEAFSDDQFDVVSVCSSTGTHIPALWRLLDENVRGVFVEKPLDCNAQQARSLGVRFNERGIPVAVNFMRRFDRELNLLRDQIRAGELGDLRSVTGWYGRGIVNNGSHLIDIVSFLTGSLPSVLWIGPHWNDGVSDDPTVTAVLVVKDIPFHMVGNVGRDYSRTEVELAFSNAVVALEQGGLKIRLRPVEEVVVPAGVRVISEGVWKTSGYGDAMLRALDELAAGNALPTSNLFTAADSISVSAAIRDVAIGRTGSRADRMFDE